MAQVDKLNYLPLLFWFVILFLAIYMLLLTKVLPMLHTILKTRRLFFINIFKRVKKYGRSIFYNYYTIAAIAYLHPIKSRATLLLNSRQNLVEF